MPVPRTDRPATEVASAITADSTAFSFPLGSLEGGADCCLSDSSSTSTDQGGKMAICFMIAFLA